MVALRNEKAEVTAVECSVIAPEDDAEEVDAAVVLEKFKKEKALPLADVVVVVVVVCAVVEIAPSRDWVVMVVGSEPPEPLPPPPLIPPLSIPPLLFWFWLALPLPTVVIELVPLISSPPNMM